MYNHPTNVVINELNEVTQTLWFIYKIKIMINSFHLGGEDTLQCTQF
jgi:hypothetical protein